VISIGVPGPVLFGQMVLDPPVWRFLGPCSVEGRQESRGAAVRLSENFFFGWIEQIKERR